MRTRAFTAGCSAVDDVLKYARHVWSPAPCAFASAWQCASAPARPPRSPPLPRPLLVTKNLVTDFSPPMAMDRGTLCGLDAGAPASPTCASLLPRHAAIGTNMATVTYRIHVRT